MLIEGSRFQIRAATPTDARALNELIAASYTVLPAAHYDPDVLARALPIMTRANPKLLASGSYFVVETVDGAAAACGGWSREEPGSGTIRDGEAHVRHFATHPHWTRRGLAAAILARCLDDARSVGLRVMHCNAMLGAERFYASAGFVTIGPVMVTMAPGITLPGTLMRRRLS